ncbi:hypothetical protein WS93_05595 [Burkholderia cepacia]|nr:hypothetical protein WS93_05595 [Burkholderia cepacia]
MDMDAQRLHLDGDQGICFLADRVDAYHACFDLDRTFSGSHWSNAFTRFRREAGTLELVTFEPVAHRPLRIRHGFCAGSCCDGLDVRPQRRIRQIEYQLLASLQIATALTRFAQADQ